MSHQGSTIYSSQLIQMGTSFKTRQSRQTPQCTTIIMMTCRCQNHSKWLA